MKLIINGTGSSGNSAFLIDKENNSLLIDAGIKPNVAKMGSPEGLLITHTHGDHYQYVEWYQNFAEQIFIEDYKLHETKSYKIVAFPLLHFKDKSKEEHIDNQGFLIFSKVEKKKLFYATDFFYRKQPDFYNPMFNFLKNQSIDLVAVECNYNDKILYTAKDVPKSYVISSQNHMSDNELVHFLSKFINQNKVNKILTLHGSNRFSIDYRVKDTLAKTFKHSRIEVAKNNHEYKF